MNSKIEEFVTEQLKDKGLAISAQDLHVIYPRRYMGGSRPTKWQHITRQLKRMELRGLVVSESPDERWGQTLWRWAE